MRWPVSEPQLALRSVGLYLQHPAKKTYKNRQTTLKQLQKDAESRLRLGIAETQGALHEFSLANSGSSALIALQEISHALPKDLTVDVTLFDFKSQGPGRGKLVFRAETDNFSTQSAIIDALKKVDVLKNIEEKSSGAKPGSDGKKIEFTIHADFQSKHS